MLRNPFSLTMTCAALDLAAAFFPFYSVFSYLLSMKGSDSYLIFNIHVNYNDQMRNAWLVADLNTVLQTSLWEEVSFSKCQFSYSEGHGVFWLIFVSTQQQLC